MGCQTSFQIDWLFSEQVDNHGQHNTDYYHRRNRNKYLTAFGFDTDIARQLAKPVQQPWSKMQYES